MRKINEIIVHCSANKATTGMDAEGIRAMHKYEFGWRDCGYHFVIELDGQVKAMRPLSQVGAHCKGHNLTSVGICYIGGLDSHGLPFNTLNRDQSIALSSLVGALAFKFSLTLDNLHCHNEFSSKACPCFDVTYLRNLCKLYVQYPNLLTDEYYKLVNQ